MGVEEPVELEVEPTESDFPYDWFFSWKQFNHASINASKEYKFAAVTDITAYFEDISLNILREQLKERLDPDYRGLIDRLFRLLEFGIGDRQEIYLTESVCLRATMFPHSYPIFI